MPITPIDIVTIAPKTQEVAGQRSHEQQRPVTEQAQQAAHMERQIQRESQQTVRKSDSDMREYRYDAKEKGNNQDFERRNGKKKKQQEEPKQQEKSLSDRRFDVRI